MSSLLRARRACTRHWAGHPNLRRTAARRGRRRQNSGQRTAFCRLHLSQASETTGHWKRNLLQTSIPRRRLAQVARSGEPHEAEERARRVAIEPRVEPLHAPRLLVRLHGQAEVERREVARRGGEDGEEEATQHLGRVRVRIRVRVGIGVRVGVGVGVRAGRRPYSTSRSEIASNATAAALPPPPPPPPPPMLPPPLPRP